MTDVKLDYLADLSYIFEVKSTVWRYIKAGIEMGTWGSLNTDLSILLSELDKLEEKVEAQIKK